jgi:hypothetical protein
MLFIDTYDNPLPRANVDARQTISKTHQKLSCAYGDARQTLLRRIKKNQSSLQPPHAPPPPSRLRPHHQPSCRRRHYGPPPPPSPLRAASVPPPPLSYLRCHNALHRHL